MVSEPAFGSGVNFKIRGLLGMGMLILLFAFSGRKFELDVRPRRLLSGSWRCPVSRGLLSLKRWFYWPRLLGVSLQRMQGVGDCY